MSLLNQKILFFIVGLTPTAIEQELITRLEGQAAKVGVRSLLSDTTFGGRAETCDGVAIVDAAGIPAAYYVDGDVEEDLLFPNVTPAAVGTEVTIENGDVVSIKSAAGTKQKDTATAAGTITLTGTVAVTVTGAALPGTPVTYQVPVLVGDTAAVWAGKVRAYLAAVVALVTHYTVSGTTTAIALEANVPAANDGTLNIALANGTATGVTAAATSANTTAGVAPTELDTGTAIVAGGVLQGVLQDNPA